MATITTARGDDVQHALTDGGVASRQCLRPVLSDRGWNTTAGTELKPGRTLVVLGLAA